MAATTGLPATPRTPGTPPRFVNAAMRLALRTPGLRRLLGKAFATITVTGARTGHRYTTPIQYVRSGEDFLVLSQRTRRWWRNLTSEPAVELLVAGKVVRGQARLAEPAEARELVGRCLQENPKVARFYRITVDAAGRPEPGALEALLARVVAIVIRPLR
jgi:deazaflavin-dependent oxidoreductase (nitroreductase family)